MGLAVAPQVVIDATKSLLQCIGMEDPSTLTSGALEPLQRWVVPWSTLWSLVRLLNPQDWILEPLLVDDAEDLATDDEDPGYGAEALDGLQKHK